MERTIPEIYMECNLIFDNDTDMDIVTKEIGLQPTSCKNKADQRKSPFKDDNLEGYWSLATNKISTFDLEEVTKIMVQMLDPYLSKIKDVVTQFQGDVVFMIVPDFTSLEKPGLNFDREILDVINYLKATVQIYMYID